MVSGGPTGRTTLRFSPELLLGCLVFPGHWTSGLQPTPTQRPLSSAYPTGPVTFPSHSEPGLKQKPGCNVKKTPDAPEATRKKDSSGEGFREKKGYLQVHIHVDQANRVQRTSPSWGENQFCPETVFREKKH